MARFEPRSFATQAGAGVGAGLGGGIKVPLIPPPPAKPAPTPVASPDMLTLDALMQRQKNAQAMAGGAMQQEVTNIPQGLSQLAWTLVSGLKERRAEKEIAAGNADVASAMQKLNYDTGEIPPDAMAVIMSRNPDLGLKLYETAIQLRNQKKTDAYGPVISGEAAAKLGLDPTKQYQLNLTTGQYDPIGGGGTNVTVGTGEKLTEALVKDTSYYPGALSANLELGDLDEALTSSPDALAGFIPGGNFLKSDAYRRAQVAGDNWIMNILRRDSGATISEDEWKSNRETFLPQPGDDRETIEYKRRLREEKTNTMRYGLEAAAPETLAKIDKDYAAKKAAWEKRRADQKKAATEPETPPPDTTTPPPDTITTPDVDPKLVRKPEQLPRGADGEVDYTKLTPAELDAIEAGTLIPPPKPRVVK
jgi:hypothetical protein